MGEELQDKELVCAGCGETFVHAVRDQEFYAEKGFQPPKRCKACRMKKKNEKESRGEF